MAATIFFAFRLSKQFERMQADKKAFDILIQALNLASARAEGAVKALKDAAAQGSETLQEKIKTAEGMANELEMIVQAGDSLASRLQKMASETRKAQAAAQPQLAAPEMEEEPEQKAPPRSRAEKELLEALKAKQQT